MQVHITKACDRCGKTEQIPVTVEEMQDALEKQERQKASIEKLKTLLGEQVDPVDGPAIVVCLKNGPGTGYKVMAFDNLCDRPADAKKKRGCQNRVRALVDDMFRVGTSAKKTKQKTKKQKESSEE